MVLNRYSAEIDYYCLFRQSLFLLKSDIAIPDTVLVSLRDAATAHPDSNTYKTLSKATTDLLRKQVTALEPLYGKGTFHRIYRATLENNKACIIRTSIEQIHHRSFDFYIDDFAMGVLKSINLPSLHIHTIDISRNECPYDLEIIEEAGGYSLNDNQLIHADNDEIIRQLGITMATYHGIQTSHAGLLDIRSILNNEPTCTGLLKTWSEFIHLNLERHIAYCFNIGAIKSSDCTYIEKLFNDSTRILDQVKPSLLHGDLSNSNIFSDGKRITAIIDWEDSIAGDPVFDIASWGTFIGNDARRDQLLHGYRSIRPLPPDFDFRYWLYYLRIILAKTVHRHRFKYDLSDRIPAAQRISASLSKIRRLYT